MSTSPEKREVEQVEATTQETVTAEPEAKKQKVEEPAAPKKEADLPAVRKQVEYYFSDINLGQDAFFHKKISENVEGWLNVDLILSCKKIQALGATQPIIFESLKESPLETKTEDGASWVRRTQPLPTLAPRNHNNKNKKSGHEGGVVFTVSNVPEGKKWGDVKDIVKVLIPKESKVVFSTQVGENRECTMTLAPFENDLEFVAKLELKMDDTPLKVELCQGDALKKALSNMPKHVQKRRTEAAAKRNKAAQKPIFIGEQKFPNINSLRGKIKEILNSRTDGMQLKPESPDFQLVKAVLEYHPRAGEKMKDMIGLKVDQSPQPGSRCFWIVREGDQFEDISAKKCIEALEANPPAPPAVEEKKEETADKKEAEKENEPVEKKEETKAEEAPKAEEAKPEEPKMEVEEAKVTA